jgi:hypothetical protein
MQGFLLGVFQHSFYIAASLRRTCKLQRCDGSVAVALHPNFSGTCTQEYQW